MLRMVGQMVGKLRRMAGEFRQQFDDAMREADLHEIKKTVSETVESAGSATSFNPMNTIRNEIKSTVEELKGVTKAAETEMMKPAEQGPPVSIMAPPLPEVPPPVFAPEPAPAAPEPAAVSAPEEPAPPARPRAKRAAKKTAGDAE